MVLFNAIFLDWLSRWCWPFFFSSCHLLFWNSDTCCWFTTCCKMADVYTTLLVNLRAQVGRKIAKWNLHMVFFLLHWKFTFVLWQIGDAWFVGPLLILNLKHYFQCSIISKETFMSLIEQKWMMECFLFLLALPPDFFRVRAKYIFSFLLGVLKQKDCFSWIFDLKKQTAQYFFKEYFSKVSNINGKLKS